MMKKVVVAAVAICVGLASAAGFQVQGYMSEAWDRHSVTIRTSVELSKIWFVLPPRSGVTLAVKADTGVAVTRRLNMSGSVDLAAVGEYSITMTRDSGAGQWTCKDVAGSPALQKFATWADTIRFARLSYVADEDLETWKFTWPKEATFLVRQVGPGGKSVEEQDLYDEDEVELVGGGTFTLEVAPTEGGGEFSASRAE